jgi:hypothetical protein
MIIGINGRIGSGKDTVGKIIQYLLCFNVGDITAIEAVTNPEHEWWLEEQTKWEIKKFAGKLKETASLLTGIPVEMFENQQFKKLNMSLEWGMTYREFLQKLGTEAMRDGLHTNVWVNALFADYKPQDAPYKHLGDLLEDKHHGVLNNPNWIITDMRFPNEMEAVKEREGITIRVVRYKVGDRVYWTDPEGVKSGVYEITEAYEGFCCIRNDVFEADVFYNEVKIHSDEAHPSETSLDDAEFDYEIVNVRSIDSLVDRVKEILTKEGIVRHAD